MKSRPNKKITKYIAKSLSKTCSNFKIKKKYLGRAFINWLNKEGRTLDYSLNHMYVVKHDGNGYKRGQKLFEKPETEYRDIYFYEKRTRESLRQLLDIFDLKCEKQIGFTREKGIFSLEENRKELENAKTLIKLDLSDAFNSITKNQIEWLLKDIFDVNNRDAEETARNWTTHGHMLQGHPIAPLIFNLLTRDIAELIAEKDGIEVIQYADDILIASDKEYVSYGYLRYIAKLYQNRGFKINLNKTRIIHTDRNRGEWEHLGLIWKETKDLRSIHRAKIRNRLRGLNHALTKATGKDREHILSVIKGLEVWLNYDPRKIYGSRPEPQKDFLEKISLSRKERKEYKRKPSSCKKADLWKCWSNPAAVP